MRGSIPGVTGSELRCARGAVGVIDTYLSQTHGADCAPILQFRASLKLREVLLQDWPELAGGRYQIYGSEELTALSLIRTPNPLPDYKPDPRWKAALQDMILSVAVTQGGR